MVLVFLRLESCEITRDSIEIGFLAEPGSSTVSSGAFLLAEGCEGPSGTVGDVLGTGIVAVIGLGSIDALAIAERVLGLPGTDSFETERASFVGTLGASARGGCGFGVCGRLPVTRLLVSAVGEGI